MLESVEQKGYHILCVHNTLTQRYNYINSVNGINVELCLYSYELKMAVTESRLIIHLQTSTETTKFPKTIRVSGYIMIFILHLLPLPPLSLSPLFLHLSPSKGGSVVMFHSLELGAFLAGCGSTVTDVLSGIIDHTFPTKGNRTTIHSINVLCKNHNKYIVGVKM